MEKVNESPINLHIMSRNKEQSEISLCRCPRDIDGQIIIAPLLEIRLQHTNKTAQVLSYEDKFIAIDFDKQNLENPDNTRINQIGYTWLLMMEKNGFEAPWLKKTGYSR